MATLEPSKLKPQRARAPEPQRAQPFPGKATMPRMIAVSAEGICRRYGRRWALVDVSFEVPEATVVMVAGRNGSGKSTLLRTLATAIRPDRGTVRILGRHSQDER